MRLFKRMLMHRIALACLVLVFMSSLMSPFAWAESENVGAATCGGAGLPDCNGSSDTQTKPTVAGATLPADVGLGVDNTGLAGGAADKCVITTAMRGTQYPCFNNGTPITTAHVTGSNDHLYHAAKIEAGVKSSQPIDVFGVCRYVDKGNQKSLNSILIPFSADIVNNQPQNSSKEWSNFVSAFTPTTTHQPNDPDVVLTYCVRGGWVDVPANYGQANPLTNQAYQCGAPQPIPSGGPPAERIKPGVGNGGTAQINMPYMRSTNYTPQSGSVTYNCVGQDGTTKFTETVNGTFDAITPIPQDVSLPTPNSVPPAGWILDTSATPPTIAYSGVCGAASGTPTTASAPTSNLCAVGVATTPTNQGTPNNVWSWSCSGGTAAAGVGNQSASCQTTAAAADAVCGSANQSQATTMPTTGLCSAGTPSTPSGKNPWTWTCTGASNNPISCATATPNYQCTTYAYQCSLNGGILHLIKTIHTNSWTDISAGNAGSVCPPGAGDDSYTTCNCTGNCACPVTSVTNGTVNADCSIACDTANGYKLSADGKSCVVADPVGCCSSCPDYGTSIGCIYLPTTQSACPTQISNGWTSQIWSSASCGFSCNPSTVANGTVNADCSIACDTANGYKLSADGKSCVIRGPQYTCQLCYFSCSGFTQSTGGCDAPYQSDTDQSGGDTCESTMGDSGTYTTCKLQ